MRVLIADKLPQDALARLESAGLDLVVDAALKEEALAAAIAAHSPEVLIVRSTAVRADMLGGGSLGLIVRAGAGTNTIDIEAASEAGIFVANCPGKNGLAVAELALGLLISADRQIPAANADLRAGIWSKGRFSKARGLAGRCLGIVGGGRIGLALAERALAMGMRVIVWNIPGEGAEERALAIGAEFEGELNSMLGQVDAVSLHLAENVHTRGIADRAFFERLGPDSIFLNTSRAGLVDEEALRWALDKRGLRAGLDVFEGEGTGASGTLDCELVRHPSVFATPHIGASTDQAQEAVADEAIRVILSYASTGDVPNVVNLARRSPASHLLIVKHLNRVGVLSAVFDGLRAAEINVLETENIIFASARTNIARLALGGAPSAELLRQLGQDNANILDLKVVPIEN
jgi:D-3-phosphoglycerate dehydrogenase